MAIDFPASPSVNDTHTVGSTTWTWDGTKWTITSGAAGATDKIEEGNTSAEVIDTGSDGRFVVTTEGTERLRVDANGRLGVGTASPQADIQAGNADGSDRSLVLHSQNNGTARVRFREGGTISSGYNEYSFGMVGSSNAMSFEITGVGEAVRIDSSGRLLAGTTSALGPSTTSTGITFFPGDYSVMSSAGNEPLTLNRNNDGAILSCRRSGTSVGSISVTTTATAFNTSSDYRLKENVTLLTGATDRLKQLPVHRFNFITDPTKTVDGFLAHEAQAVVPECVTGEKDAVDADGNPIYQGIDQSKLVPLLTAALQEAVARIEAQDTTIASQAATIAAIEARLTALEGGTP